MTLLDPMRPALWWANVRALAEVCAHTYGLTPNDCAGQEEWIIDPHTDAHALVQDRGDCLVVCFRGSKDAKDYLQDAKFATTDLVYSDGELPASVHKGFLEDFDALNTGLVRAVRSMAVAKAPAAAGPGDTAALRPIFITGHSLGGGIAILCALEFARQGFFIHSVTTFGQPRVGNQAFCNIYEESLRTVTTARIVNANDIVPRVPPLLNGYRHTGRLAFLLPGGGWKLDPSLWARAVADEAGLWMGLEKWKNVPLVDHHIESYQGAIANL